MAITAVMVRDLRAQSGAGIMECKEALKETDGDIAASLEYLRKKGTVKAAKKADRSTKEGAVAGIINATSAALAEIKCETDFVARNEKFQEFANNIVAGVLTNGPADSDDAFAAQHFAEANGPTVQEALTKAVHEMGENIVLGRRERFTLDGAGGFGLYIHGAGSIGVLVELGCEKNETASSDIFLAAGKDLAMHIAATNPIALSPENIPADTLAKEREIFEAQAKESGKPEKIVPKIVEGRMKKYCAENCLTLQSFVKDPDQTIASYLTTISKELGDTLTIRRFIRFQLGE